MHRTDYLRNTGTYGATRDYQAPRREKERTDAYSEIENRYREAAEAVRERIPRGDFVDLEALKAIAREYRVKMQTLADRAGIHVETVRKRPGYPVHMWATYAADALEPSEEEDSE